MSGKAIIKQPTLHSNASLHYSVKCLCSKASWLRTERSQLQCRNQIFWTFRGSYWWSRIVSAYLVRWRKAIGSSYTEQSAESADCNALQQPRRRNRTPAHTVNDQSHVTASVDESQVVDHTPVLYSLITESRLLTVIIAIWCCENRSYGTR